MIRKLTHNLVWKLLSLLVAILLWLALVGDPELTTTLSVPLEFRNLPRELEISSEVPERLRLEVRGPSGKLSAAMTAGTAAIIDLKPVDQAGERTFSIQPANVSLPTGVALYRAIPSQVRLTLERRLTRLLPVHVRYSSQPPQGYAIERQEVRPDHLMVIGPEARVLRIDAVETDPIDLASITLEGSFRVHTYVSDPQVRFGASNVVAVKVYLKRAPAKAGRP